MPKNQPRIKRTGGSIESALRSKETRTRSTINSKKGIEVEESKPIENPTPQYEVSPVKNGNKLHLVTALRLSRSPVKQQPETAQKSPNRNLNNNTDTLTFSPRKTRKASLDNAEYTSNCEITSPTKLKLTRSPVKHQNERPSLALTRTDSGEKENLLIKDSGAAAAAQDFDAPHEKLSVRMHKTPDNSGYEIVAHSDKDSNIQSQSQESRDTAHDKSRDTPQKAQSRSMKVHIKSPKMPPSEESAKTFLKSPKVSPPNPKNVGRGVRGKKQLSASKDFLSPKRGKLSGKRLSGQKSITQFFSSPKRDISKPNNDSSISKPNTSNGSKSDSNSSKYEDDHSASTVESSVENGKVHIEDMSSTTNGYDSEDDFEQESAKSKDKIKSDSVGETSKDLRDTDKIKTEQDLGSTSEKSARPELKMKINLTSKSQKNSLIRQHKSKISEEAGEKSSNETDIEKREIQEVSTKSKEFHDPPKERSKMTRRSSRRNSESGSGTIDNIDGEKQLESKAESETKEEVSDDKEPEKRTRRSIATRKNTKRTETEELPTNPEAILDNQLKESQENTDRERRPRRRSSAIRNGVGNTNGAAAMNDMEPSSEPRKESSVNVDEEIELRKDSEHQQVGSAKSTKKVTESQIDEQPTTSGELNTSEDKSQPQAETSPRKRGRPPKKRTGNATLVKSESVATTSENQGTSNTTLTRSKPIEEISTKSTKQSQEEHDEKKKENAAVCEDTIVSSSKFIKYSSVEDIDLRESSSPPPRKRLRATRRRTETVELEETPTEQIYSKEEVVVPPAEPLQGKDINTEESQEDEIQTPQHSDKHAELSSLNMSDHHRSESLVDDSETPIIRKRGRPPKNKQPSSDSHSHFQINTEKVDSQKFKAVEKPSAESSVVADDEKAPRKDSEQEPLPSILIPAQVTAEEEDDGNAVNDHPSPQKRGRGRPKKIRDNAERMKAGILSHQENESQSNKGQKRKLDSSLDSSKSKGIHNRRSTIESHVGNTSASGRVHTETGSAQKEEKTLDPQSEGTSHDGRRSSRPRKLTSKMEDFKEVIAKKWQPRATSPRVVITLEDRFSVDTEEEEKKEEEDTEEEEKKKEEDDEEEEKEDALHKRISSRSRKVPAVLEGFVLGTGRKRKADAAVVDASVADTHSVASALDNETIEDEDQKTPGVSAVKRRRMSSYNADRMKCAVAEADTLVNTNAFVRLKRCSFTSAQCASLKQQKKYYDDDDDDYDDDDDDVTEDEEELEPEWNAEEEKSSSKKRPYKKRTYKTMSINVGAARQVQDSNSAYSDTTSNSGARSLQQTPKSHIIPRSSSTLIASPAWLKRINHRTAYASPDNVVSLKDIFKEDKELYELHEKRFEKELTSFMEQHGKKIQKVPTWYNHKLNLFMFYMAVQELGGSQAVSKNKKWLHLYHTMIGYKVQTANSLKKYFMINLLGYEQYMQGDPRYKATVADAPDFKKTCKKRVLDSDNDDSDQEDYIHEFAGLSDDEEEDEEEEELTESQKQLLLELMVQQSQASSYEILKDSVAEASSRMNMNIIHYDDQELALDKSSFPKELHHLFPASPKHAKPAAASTASNPEYTIANEDGSGKSSPETFFNLNPAVIQPSDFTPMTHTATEVEEDANYYILLQNDSATYAEDGSFCAFIPQGAPVYTEASLERPVFMTNAPKAVILPSESFCQEQEQEEEDDGEYDDELDTTTQTDYDDYESDTMESNDDIDRDSDDDDYDENDYATSDFRDLQDTSIDEQSDYDVGQSVQLETNEVRMKFPDNEAANEALQVVQLAPQDINNEACQVVQLAPQHINNEACQVVRLAPQDINNEACQVVRLAPQDINNEACQVVRLDSHGVRMNISDVQENGVVVNISAVNSSQTDYAHVGQLDSQEETNEVVDLNSSLEDTEETNAHIDSDLIEIDSQDISMDSAEVQDYQDIPLAFNQVHDDAENEDKESEVQIAFQNVPEEANEIPEDVNEIPEDVNEIPEDVNEIPMFGEEIEALDDIDIVIHNSEVIE